MIRDLILRACAAIPPGVRDCVLVPVAVLALWLIVRAIIGLEIELMRPPG